MRRERQDALSSHWTIALSEQGYFFSLAAIFLAHCFLSASIPPAEDELYYWTWAKHLSPSYFDHPPMVAWWIALSTRLFGNSLWAIRLPAFLTHFFLFFILGRLSPRKSVLYWLLLTPLSLFGAVFMTPDIPLLLFWLLYVRWAISIDQTLGAWGEDPVSRVYQPRPVPLFSWLQGAMLLGLGLLSKYTMALAPLCLFFLLVKYRLGAWYRGFLLHGLIGLVLFGPVIFFNSTHHFAPFAFQWSHIQQGVPYTFLYTFLGNQILLLGALPFLLIPWLLFNYSLLSRNSLPRVLTYFFIIPMVFFLYKATHHFMEANWALVAYLSFWPLSSYFLQISSFRFGTTLCILIAFAVPVALSFLLTIHLIKPLGFIQISQDRLSKLSAQFQLVKDIAGNPGVSKEIPIFLTNYQWASYFSFLGFTSVYQLPDSGRPSQFTLNPIPICAFKKAYFFHLEGDIQPSSLSCYDKALVVSSAPLLVRGIKLAGWEIVELTQK